MKKNASDATPSRGERPAPSRRSFSWEFKQEAVRLMKERQRLGTSLAQIGRELGVRSGVLRTWAQLVERTERPAAAGSTLSPDEELRRVRRELDITRQERDFLKRLFGESCG